MNSFEQLHEAFQITQRKFFGSAGIRRLLAGSIGVAHYACYLGQVFHHTRENPQIQALATVYFRGHQRVAIKRFFRHASSELGHDLLALEDLRALGVDVSQLPYENPLPETTALIAFPFHQIYNLRPVGYLGYLYFLEFLPTGSGRSLMDALGAVGVPKSAMGFLQDHTTIDQGHNAFMRSYARTLITTQRELDSAIYAMQVTSALYARMIDAAFTQADAPFDYGLSAEEGGLSVDAGARREAKTGERPVVRFPFVTGAEVEEDDSLPQIA